MSTSARLVKSAARTVLHGFGGLSLVREYNRRGARILMYHGFSAATRPLLEEQCRHVREFYRPVSLNDVVEAATGGRPLPARAVTVTVDDGYRNFLLHGWPVFQKHGIPATVYLVTDFLDGRIWLWWNRIQHACAVSKLALLESPFEPGSKSFVLDTPAAREAAAEEIIARLKKLPHVERLQTIEKILETLGVAADGPAPLQYEPLRWEEVRTLNAEGVEFGAHTCTHPVLTMVSDRALLHREICESRRRVTDELGRPASHFAYPNGNHDDATVEAVAECGFRSATTTHPGLNRPMPNPLLLERVPVDSTLELHYFKEVLAGLHLA